MTPTMMLCPCLAAFLTAVVLLTAAPQRAEAAPPETPMPAVAKALTQDLYPALATEIDQNLQQQVLMPWFPRAIDTEHGGFYEGFDEQWKRPAGDPNTKSIVYQSRLTWVAAKASERYPAQASTYRAAAQQGLQCLSEKLWDRNKGGFYWSVSETGAPNRNGEKHAYGISFAIYAASAVYEATRDPKALDLAKRAYAWLETHAHDAKNGGYYEAFDRDGRPILATPTTPDAPTSDPIGTHYGYKSMNTHIHLLEAFTALYEMWPNAGLRARLQEMLSVVRDKVAVDPGCLNLFFTPQWRPIPDHDSFGHDVETAYLITETSAVLGRPDDGKTWTVARKLVDHALEYGWDEKNGGFYDAGPAFGAATVTDKVWWTQAEGLNALLLMHERYGNETPRFGAAFLKQWAFITAHQIDTKNTGWLSSVSAEGVPVPGQVKSDAWKDPYHQGRALLNVSESLRKTTARKAGKAD